MPGQYLNKNTSYCATVGGSLKFSPLTATAGSAQTHTFSVVASNGTISGVSVRYNNGEGDSGTVAASNTAGDNYSVDITYNAPVPYNLVVVVSFSEGVEDVEVLLQDHINVSGTYQPTVASVLPTSASAGNVAHTFNADITRNDFISGITVSASDGGSNTVSGVAATNTSGNAWSVTLNYTQAATYTLSFVFAFSEGDNVTVNDDTDIVIS